MRVVVIIPAAGLGTRMAAQSGVRPGQTTKQFAEIAGKPILLHTLEKFSQVSEVSDIYIAVRENEAERLRDFLAGQRLRPKMHVLVGGDHRQHSVANALATVKADAHDVVLVHDAVRPFVDSEIIENVIEAAAKHGAAIAGLPAVDTIKQVERTAEGAIITSTVPRERVVMAQTPQGFRYDLLKRVFDDAAQDGFIGTDEASLVERAGYDVAVVMGSPRNIKITTPSDMELAEFYAKQLHHGDRKNRVIR
ncbi:MAG: 2-C-methyl-D-erythritol 4-phosphate cytidylyltransferase [Acidobacteria bacterium]|nr:MAG: 2-C-methyl-D-erythritol 4-phosphate cytidylyltransferase [Acidobacteriota bacterium]PYY22664.1 MAG: 2-C-methyl-D-erythritol 4-phosphate cytidylyltransferase [Acidobacteriota bacterium]